MVAIAPKEAVKDAILDATDRLLARYGYRKMTVEDIAVETGIGKGTIYLHFERKDDLLVALWEEAIGRFAPRMSAIRPETP